MKGNGPHGHACGHRRGSKRGSCSDPKEAVRKKHEYAAAVLAALDAQLNKHEDPQSVYEKYLKPHGIAEQAWSYRLLIGQTEEGKKSLMNDMNLTVEAATQAFKNFDWSYPAKYKKMNQRIDDQNLNVRSQV